MRLSLSLKTLYRSPVRTLLTFILLGIVSFAVFSQTVEYAVVAREFDKAALEYIGVGSVEISPPLESDPSVPLNLILSGPDALLGRVYSHMDGDETAYTSADSPLYRKLTQEQVNTILSLPYISSSDTRYMTAGISDKYYRQNNGMNFYDFAARNVYEATLSSVVIPSPPDSLFVTSFNRILLNDIKLLSGFPVTGEYAQRSFNFFVEAITRDEYYWSDGQELINNKHGNDTRYRTAAKTPSLMDLASSQKYNTEFLENLAISGRYIIVTRGGPPPDFMLYLGDHLSNPWCDAIWPIDGEPENYLETEEFEPIRKLIEITNADSHTFDMVYTEDMRSIRRFSEGDMTIIDGRALTKQDSLDDASVCVVNFRIADYYRLKVGDTLTFSLGTNLFEQYKNLGAVAAVPERYSPPVKTVELEIVGIYADLDSADQQLKEPHWGYSFNTVFVPKSLLPVAGDDYTNHEFAPGEFSFLIEDAWDIPAFLDETMPLLEEMGLTVFFGDGGWLVIADMFLTVREQSIVRIAIFVAAFAVATLFAAYLFISRKKKDFATMRALGATKRNSERALVFPLMLVAVIAILIGSSAAWVYTSGTIAENNAFAVLEGFAVNASIPLHIVAVCVLGQLLLLMLLSFALLRRIGYHPPLVLLQGAPQMRNENTEPSQSEFRIPNSKLSHPIPNSAFRIPNSQRFAFRYAWRHLRRSARKTVLSIALAALLVFAVSSLALAKQSSIELFNNTSITANYTQWLSIPAASEIMDSGLFSKSYYELRQNADFFPYAGYSFNSDWEAFSEYLDSDSREMFFGSIMSMHDYVENVGLVTTNDISRYLGEEFEITFADGYDMTSMEWFGDNIVIGKSLAEENGFELGAKVMLTRNGYRSQTESQFYQTYRRDNPTSTLIAMEILKLYQDDIDEYIKESTSTLVWTVVGIIETASGDYDNMVFSSGSAKASMLFSALSAAEFIVADNQALEEAREFAETFSILDSLTMDTSKIESPANTVRLMTMFYPIGVAAALLIGAFLCCLTVLQSSKEAAIMRVLGTSKRITRAILTLERTILSVFGLLLGAAALLVLHGAGIAAILGQIALFAALYFGVILVSAIVCSTMATRRSTLELLQTKE